jgi:type IV pilus assembly protein PilN
VTYKVNLLPSKLRREGLVDVRRLIIISVTTLVIAAILGGYGTFLFLFFNQKSELDNTRQQLASLTPIANRVQEMRKERKEMEATLQAYSSLLKKQIIWSDLFYDLNKITPVDLWLVEVEISPPKEEQKDNQAKIINLKGFSLTVPSIGLFMNNLSQLSYFKEVKLVKLNKESGGISFQITTLLRE